MKPKSFSVAGVATKLQSITDIIDALSEEGFRLNEDLYILNNSQVAVYTDTLEKFNKAVRVMVCFKFYSLDCKIS